MKLGAYNIVIDLPASARRQAVAVSKRLHKKGGIFALGEKIFIPHITIYLTDIPKKNEKKVVVALGRLAKKLSPISCNALHYWNPRSGYVGVLYRRTKIISDLQKAVIAAINPLRENVLTLRDKTRLSQLPAGEKKNIKRFGDGHVGLYYHPHVTLSRFTKDRELSHENISTTAFSFRALSIGLYHRGDHGSCKKLIARFPLLAK
jgi:2'-5' RNA ligase